MRVIEAANVAQALPGAHIAACLEAAKNAGFDYLLHNGQLYDVFTGRRVQCAYQK